jgi:hypothetical protein
VAHLHMSASCPALVQDQMEEKNIKLIYHKVFCGAKWGGRRRGGWVKFKVDVRAQVRAAKLQSG